MSRRLLLAAAFAALALPASAGGLEDFLNNLDVQARADRSGFSAQIGTHFQVGGAQVNLVLGQVEHPADAFMVFELGRMTGKPAEEVLRVYRQHKGRGWGELAKELGIKPGSAEFHRLKRGDFDFGGERRDGDAGPGKGRGKGHGKGHGKDHGPH